MTEAPRQDLPATPSKELSTGALLQSFGGARGIFDSSVPATVFVIARLVGTLNQAIGAAVVAGLVIVVLRKVRGESLQQAFSGFFGLVIAVVISRSTGTGKGFFLPGIVITAATGVAFAISLIVRRPAIALGLTALDPKYGIWRDHPALKRATTIATAVWTVSFFVRAGVASAVALTVGDNARDNIILLVVINVVKWPLIIGSALYTVALVKRCDVPDASPAPP